MSFTIDRFEGDFAIAQTENGDFFNFPKALLPADAKEGDVFDMVKNNAETKSRKKRIENLMNDLFE